MAIETEVGDLGSLPDEIQKVEFKLTVQPDEEHKVQKLLRDRRADPERRRVYFYDTRALDLDAAHVVVRSRVIQGDDDDSTVKLRPAPLAADAGWREVDDIAVEMDVVGAKHVVSAKLEGTPEPGEIEDVEAEERSVRSLLGKAQEKLVKAYAHGVSLDELEVLGPVDARKWELEDLDGFPYELCVEEWSLPDASRFIELSTKVSRPEALAAQAAFYDLMSRLGIRDEVGQTPKTPRVLQFFVDRLSARD